MINSESSFRILLVDDEEIARNGFFATEQI